jgi:alkylhydroperoxidase family enzyme
MTPEEIRGIMEMDRKYIDDREYKVLKYSIKAAKEPRRITDQEFDDIRNLGFSNVELLEITETIANAVYQVIYADSLANRLSWLQIAAGNYK